jgi:hypothetical protein
VSLTDADGVDGPWDRAMSAVPRKRAARAGRPAPATRNASVCHACGTEFSPCDEPAPIRGCPEHGERLVEVQLLRAEALMGRTPLHADGLTSGHVSDVLAFVSRIDADRRTEDERRLLRACERGLRGSFWSRKVVADAFNALFGGVTEAA